MVKSFVFLRTVDQLSVVFDNTDGLTLRINRKDWDRLGFPQRIDLDLIPQSNRAN